MDGKLMSNRFYQVLQARRGIKSISAVMYE